MPLRLTRTGQSPRGTTGTLWLDAAPIAVTLEDAPQKDKGPIPAGTYRVTLDLSPHFLELRPHLQDVPGFEDILIHVGNTTADTVGCILVGRYAVTDGEIAESRLALSQLLARWREWEGGMLEIAGP